MSNNLNLSQVANNQASKEVTINSALLQIDAATTEHVSISVASANGDITAAQLTRNVHFYITAATVVGRIVTVDTPTKRLIAVEADATNTQSVDLVCGTTHITIKPGSCFIVYLDGTANGAKAINAPGALASLSDVNVATLPDKAVLRYDLASGKWLASLWAVTSQAASYTFVLADSNSTVECTAAGAATFTIPLNASVAFSVGTEIECVQYGAGLLTIAGAGGVTLHGVSLVTTTQYQRLLLRKVATDEWNVAIIGSAAGGGGGATASTGLTDMPATLTAYKGLRVNSAGTAYEQIDLPYDVMVYAEGLLTASEVVYQLVATRAFRIPSGASGSAGKAGVAATASTTVNLTKNGTGFGTMVWAASGTAATVTVSADTDFAVGDTLTINAPATADVSLANVTFAIAGIRR